MDTTLVKRIAMLQPSLRTLHDNSICLMTFKRQPLNVHNEEKTVISPWDFNSGPKALNAFKGARILTLLSHAYL